MFQKDQFLTIYASRITKLIQRKIQLRFEENLGEDQFDFKNNRGIHEAIPYL